MTLYQTILLSWLTLGIFMLVLPSAQQLIFLIHADLKKSKKKKSLTLPVNDADMNPFFIVFFKCEYLTPLTQ